MKQEANRYLFIDILKGISILLVIYGHITPGLFPTFTQYVGTFHMPLFFFVSGILFNEDKYRENFKEFFVRRFNGLVVPYLYFSVIVALCFYFVKDNYFDFLRHLLLWGWGGYALWFIPVLFLSQFLYYPISKLKVGWKVCAILILLFLSLISSKFIGYIPYNLGLCFCGAYFFGVGNLLRRPLPAILKKCVGYRVPLIFAICFAISLLYLIQSKQPEWFINDVPSILFLVVPFGAIACVAIFAILIEKMSLSFVTNFFSTCGKQSYILLAFHQIICLVLPSSLPSKVKILLMILILTFFVWFIPSYMPWMLGKTNFIHKVENR